MHEGDGDGGDRKGADRRPEPEGAANGWALGGGGTGR